jgi:uncharacterized membrane protein
VTRKYSVIEWGKFDGWLLLPLVAALLLRLVRLDAAALWLDETFTARWVALPWAEMLRAVLADNHLPLYFVAAKAWISIATDSPWALRLFSVLLSWAMVPLITATAATLSGRSAARWAAWLAALSPYLLQHAQDARMYAMLGFLAAIHLLLVARFVVGHTKQLGFGFFVVNAAMLATHYYAVFLIAVEFPVLFLLQRSRWRTWLPALVASFVLFIGPILAAKYLATPHAGGNYDAMGLIALPGMVWALLTGYTLMPSSDELHGTGLRAALPYIPVALVAVFALALIAWRGLRSLPRPAWILLVGQVLGVLLGPLAMSLVFDIGINPRYAMTAAPAFIAFLAAGLATAANQRLGWAAAVALLAVMSIASYLHLKDPGHGREDVLAAGTWLDRNVPIDEEILITSEELAILARFHWPQRRFILYPAKRTVVGSDNVDAVAAALPLANHQRVIFMIGREWLSDPQGLLVTKLTQRYQGCEGVKLRGIRIVCINPRAPHAELGN